MVIKFLIIIFLRQTVFRETLLQAVGIQHLLGQVTEDRAGEHLVHPHIAAEVGFDDLSFPHVIDGDVPGNQLHHRNIVMGFFRSFQHTVEARNHFEITGCQVHAGRKCCHTLPLYVQRPREGRTVQVDTDEAAAVLVVVHSDLRRADLHQRCQRNKRSVQHQCGQTHRIHRAVVQSGHFRVLVDRILHYKQVTLVFKNLCQLFTGGLAEKLHALAAGQTAWLHHNLPLLKPGQSQIQRLVLSDFFKPGVVVNPFYATHDGQRLFGIGQQLRQIGFILKGEDIVFGCGGRPDKLLQEIVRNISGIPDAAPVVIGLPCVVAHVRHKLVLSPESIHFGFLLCSQILIRIQGVGKIFKLSVFHAFLKQTV